MASFVLALLALLGACAVSVQGQGQWYTGRATNYGSLQDPWSIHTGSCGYGYLDATVKTGWDVAAISDQAPDFGGSCGRCYEIQCQPLKFKDNYGEQLDRNDACYDSSASVVVQITDSCPCVYPTNAYSNKRWCCGDMYHFDMSLWAFEKLASTRYGVIGIRFRPVPCKYQPNKWAPLQSKVSPGYAPPNGWSSSQDRRPWSSSGATPSS